MVSTAGVSQAQGPVLPEIAYLRFEEGSGAVTLDEAVPGVGASPTVVPANWSTLPLIGVSSLDCNLPTLPLTAPCATNGAFILSGSWTIEVELHRTSNPSIPAEILKSQGAMSFVPAIDMLLDVTNPSNVLLTIANDVGTSFSISIPNGAPLGVQSHVAVVHDAAASMLLAYRNGVLVNSAVVPPFGVFTSNPSGLLVGSNGAFLTSNRFPGLIDEVRIWSRARSAAAISAYAHRELFGLGLPLQSIDFNLPLPLLTFNTANGTVSAGGTIASATLLGGTEVNTPATDPLVSAPFNLSGIYGGSDLAALSDVLLLPATLTFTPSIGVDALSLTTQVTAMSSVQVAFDSPSSALPMRYRVLSQSSPATSQRTGSGSVLLDSVNMQMASGSTITLECSLTPGGAAVKSLHFDYVAPTPVPEARLRQLGAGGVQIGVINVAPFSAIYDVFALNPVSAQGAGPLFGIEFTAFQLDQLSLPFPTPPFKVFANAEGYYSFNLPISIVSPGTVIDMVSIAVLPGGATIGFVSPVQRTVF